MRMRGKLNGKGRFGFALLFINVIFGTYLGPDLTNSYIVGLIILGGSPCTAMVFVWSMLMRGNATYTLTQVAVNDLLLLGLFAPTVKLLAGTTSVTIPWETLLLSVVFFVLIPLVLGLCIRWVIVKHRGVEFLESQVLGRMKPFSMVFLLLTLVLIFIVRLFTSSFFYGLSNDGTTVPSPNTHREPRPHSDPCSSNHSSNDFCMGVDVHTRSLA